MVRYTLPGIGALNFVMRWVLGGGFTRSLALDAHGKRFLDLELPGERRMTARGSISRLLAGKVAAAVTGSTNGIGLAIARRLAAAGA